MDPGPQRLAGGNTTRGGLSAGQERCGTAYEMTRAEGWLPVASVLAGVAIALLTIGMSKALEPLLCPSGWQVEVEVPPIVVDV